MGASPLGATRAASAARTGGEAACLWPALAGFVLQAECSRASQGACWLARLPTAPA